MNEADNETTRLRRTSEEPESLEPESRSRSSTNQMTKAGWSRVSRRKRSVVSLGILALNNNNNNSGNNTGGGATGENSTPGTTGSQRYLKRSGPSSRRRKTARSTAKVNGDGDNYDDDSQQMRQAGSGDEVVAANPATAKSTCDPTEDCAGPKSQRGAWQPAPSSSSSDSDEDEAEWRTETLGILANERRIRINLSGRIFEVERKTLMTFPDTRLCWLLAKRDKLLAELQQRRMEEHIRMQNNRSQHKQVRRAGKKCGASSRRQSNKPNPISNNSSVNKQLQQLQSTDNRQMSLMTSLGEQTTLEEEELFILSECYFDLKNGEFFFDRHAASFELVINFYRTGKLHMPVEVCGALFATELEFWGVDEELMEPCCYSTFRKHHQARRAMEKMTMNMDMYESDDGDDYNEGFFMDETPMSGGLTSRRRNRNQLQTDSNHTFSTTSFVEASFSTNMRRRMESFVNTFGKVKLTIWHHCFGENKSAKLYGKRPGNIYHPKVRRAYQFISFSLAFVFVLVFCLETVRSCRVPLSGYRSAYRNSSMVDENADFHDYKSFFLSSKPHVVLFYLDLICSTFFVLEFLLRTVTWPGPHAYRGIPALTERAPPRRLKSWKWWFDIMSAIPTFIIIIIEYLTGPDVPRGVKIYLCQSLKLLKLLRLSYVFNWTRKFPGLHIIWHTFAESASELVLVILICIPGVLICGVLVFYVETIFTDPHPSTVKTCIESIPLGFWWASVTMTTVGYGDYYPSTTLGYCIGVLCLVAGVLFVGLPIPVIVSNFSLYYEHAQALQRMKKRPRAAILASLPNQLKQAAADGTFNLERMLESAEGETGLSQRRRQTIKPSMSPDEQKKTTLFLKDDGNFGEDDDARENGFEANKISNDDKEDTNSIQSDTTTTIHV